MDIKLINGLGWVVGLRLIAHKWDMGRLYGCALCVYLGGLSKGSYIYAHFGENHRKLQIAKSISMTGD